MIALDTHVLVWWVAEPKRIPARARRALDAAVKADEPLAVSSISLRESALLVQRGRLAFTMDAGTRLQTCRPCRCCPFTVDQSGQFG